MPVLDTGENARSDSNADEADIRSMRNHSPLVEVHKEIEVGLKTAQFRAHIFRAKALDLAFGGDFE